MTGQSRAFRDRLREGEALERLLSDARNGRSGVLVVRGEAGIGKSALVRTVAERASGFRVAEIAGVESEMELPFAGLHQLLAPMLARVDGLPAPQQRALRVALGLASGDAPDRFLVALGTLTLLAEAADEEPFLCIVEDAQWLDGASRQVLGFVARRLLAEPVALVFAVREPSSAAELAGLPELVLTGLDDEDARALLATVIPGRLDDRVRDRIVAETRGNPLALLELPRGLSSTQLAGGFGMPDVVPSVGSDRGELRAASRRAASADAAPAPARGGGTGRRPRADVARREGVGDPDHGYRPRGRWVARGRGEGSLSPSAGAVGRLSVGVGGRAPQRARSVGGGDRCRPRAGSPRLAPGARRSGRGRGGRRRARAVRRPRPGAAAASPRRPRSWAAPPT